MAVGKNKRLSKKGKGGKKKIVNAFLKKEWFRIKSPKYFEVEGRNVGWTCANKTIGQNMIRDNLIDRVYQVNLGDLAKDPYSMDASDETTTKKIKLQCEEVLEQSREVLTNFYGMDMTSDKQKSLIKKWQTLVEAVVDIKTTDGYVLRLSCIGFTKKLQGQMRKTSYAKTSQVRSIRQKMVSVIRKEVEDCTLQSLVQKLIPNLFGSEVQKQCESVYPLELACIRKVKMLKKAKFDQNRLFEMHTDTPDADAGEDVDRAPEDDDAAGSDE